MAELAQCAEAQCTFSQAAVAEISDPHLRRKTFASNQQVSDGTSEDFQSSRTHVSCSGQPRATAAGGHYVSTPRPWFDEKARPIEKRGRPTESSRRDERTFHSDADGGEAPIIKGLRSATDLF